MDTAAKNQPDLSTHLAAERTFLAWIRTGVACMGFGFVVARFGIFLHEAGLISNAFSARSYGPSQWLGTALVAAGVLMNAISAWHHARLVGQLNRGEPPPSRPSTQAVILALFLAMIGLGMVIYLILLQSAHLSTRSSSDTKGNTSMTPMTDNGIINKPTHRSFDETAGKLKSILQAEGIGLSALIDHSGEAEKVGMKMKPTKLMIFGAPKLLGIQQSVSSSLPTFHAASERFCVLVSHFLIPGCLPGSASFAVSSAVENDFLVLRQRGKP